MNEQLTIGDLWNPYQVRISERLCEPDGEYKPYRTAACVETDELTIEQQVERDWLENARSPRV